MDPKLAEEQADARYGDEEKLLQTGLEKRANLKGQVETTAAAHWDVKSQWGSYLPHLDLIGSMTSGASYLYNQSVNGQNVVPAVQTGLESQLGSQIVYSAGIYLTWNIFDRFLTHQAVETARVKADNADLQAGDLKNQVQADVRQAYGNYKTALQQLRASKKGQVAAEKAYEVIEGRYEVGAANFIDLITAQATLLQAESTRAQALIDFTLQGKSLEFATGELKVD